MIHFSNGKRIGIDTKYSSKNFYTGRISEQILTGIANAIHSAEINEFHFLSNVKFSNAHKRTLAKVLLEQSLPPKAINFHENFWPDNF